MINKGTTRVNIHVINKGTAGRTSIRHLGMVGLHSLVASPNKHARCSARVAGTTVCSTCFIAKAVVHQWSSRQACWLGAGSWK